jgi:hypothetical protein
MLARHLISHFASIADQGQTLIVYGIDYQGHIEDSFKPTLSTLFNGMLTSQPKPTLNQHGIEWSILPTLHEGSGGRYEHIKHPSLLIDFSFLFLFLFGLFGYGSVSLVSYPLFPNYPLPLCHRTTPRSKIYTGIPKHPIHNSPRSSTH